MKPVVVSLACLLALAAGAAAQPAVNAGGIVNAASYAVPGLPNGGIAQGSMFAVFGTNLGAASDPNQLTFPLQTTLQGTSIRVTSGGVNKDALMIYTSPTQAAAILPSDTPTGTATLTVSVNGQASAPQPFNVVEGAFGIFTRNQAGSGPAIVQNFVSQGNEPNNALIVAANPGQIVTLWGTGLGAVTGNEAGGPLPGKVFPVEVFVGGQAVTASYAGRSGCCAAIDQISFQVPQGVLGCYVPVFVRVNGVPSNFGSMSVAANGSMCSEPGGFSAADVEKLANGGRTGTIVLSRTGIEIAVPGLGSITTTADTGAGTFAQFTSAEFLATQGVSGLPSVGSCTVIPFQGGEILPQDPVKGTDLDAGPALNINGPRGAKQLTKTTGSKGLYTATLGGGGIGSTEPGYLDPGTYTLDNNPGGADIGPFSASLTAPAAITWTNRSAVTAGVIARSQPLTLTWTGGDPNGLVEIAGASSFSGGGATFICTARADAGQFTVPASILSALPASSNAGGAGAGGFLLLGSSGQPVQFTATGLDLGRAFFVDLSGNTVTYQ